jgi:hypothetical protein
MLGSLVVVLGLVILCGLVAGIVTLTRDHGLSVVTRCCQRKSVFYITRPQIKSTAASIRPKSAREQ